MLGFLSGNALVALASISSGHGLTEAILGPPDVAGGWYLGPGWLFIGGPDNPTFGRNHITQSAFLALAAMIALGRAWNVWHGRGSMAICLLWIIGGLLYLQPIFLMQSRTGYLLTVTLVLYWIFIFIRYLTVKKAVVPIFILTVGVFTMVAANHHVVTRVNLMVESGREYIVERSMTDSGVRLEFWKSSIEILTSNPTVGVGLGGFAEAYSRLPHQQEMLKVSRNQPHSEYALILVQSGLVGCAIFLLLIFFCMKNGIFLLKERPEAMGLIVLYFFDGIFNSVIWDLAEGHILPIIVLYCHMAVGKDFIASRKEVEN